MRETTNDALELTREVVSRLDRLPLTNFHWLVIIAAGISSFFDYYNFSAMSFVIYSVKQQFALTPFQTSLVLSSTFVGAFVGGIIAGYLADIFGRRRWFLITLSLIAIGALSVGLSVNYYQLIASLLLMGFSITGDYSIAETYISEFVPSGMRAKAMGIVVGVASTAFLFTALVGSRILSVSPVFGWRVIFFIGAVIALAVLLVRKLVPESPRYYAQKGMKELALKALESIEQRARKSYGRELPPPSSVKIVISENTTSFRELFKREYLSRTLHSSLAYVFDSMGFYGFVTFLPLILVSKGFTIVNSLFYIALADIGAIIGGAGLYLIGERVERKDLMALSGLIIAGSTLALAFSINPLFVVAFGFIASFFDQCSYAALSIYLAEIFPTRIRNTGVGFASSMARVVSIAGIFYLGVALSGKPVLQLSFIATSWLVYSAILYLFGIRVNNRVLEDVSP